MAAMADPSPSPATQESSNPPPSQSPISNPNPNPNPSPNSNLSPNPNPNPNPIPSVSSSESQPNSTQSPASTPPPPAPPAISPTPTSAPPFHPPPINPYAAPPSFRPAGAPPPMHVPQFTPIPQNPNMQGFQQQPNHGVPPPGVSSAPLQQQPLMPGKQQTVIPGQQQQPMMPGQQQQPMMPGQQPMRPPYMPMPNGYMHPPPHGSLPPGVVRYPYPPMARPPFLSRPGVTVGMVPQLQRPPFLGLRPPMTLPVVRPPVVPVVLPPEKPQTTVYVGKIAPSVENDFIRSLLELCGPIKSWKRAQDPSDGTPRRFGFCEFESAEGVLRALRLLSKCNVDGEELVLNVNQATREYLERYVEKKKENLTKPSETEVEEAKKEGESAPDAEKSETKEKEEPAKIAPEEPKKDANETENKENDLASFGLVTDEDRDVDREALDKLTNMIEERIKTKPLPPPPPPAQKVADGTNNSNSEVPAKSGDKDSDVNPVKNEDKMDDETTSESKPSNRTGTESPDRSRRYDNRSRDRNRRDKERELDRLERERERERARREKERDLEILKAERFYKERVKEWETREKEREYERRREREKEKERERERRRLVAEQEDESDDDSRKRRRKSEIEDKRRRRRREKEDDMADRLKEEEEIVEAKKRAEEEQQRQQEKQALELPSVPVDNGSEKPASPLPEVTASEIKDDMEQDHDSEAIPAPAPALASQIGDGVIENGGTDEPTIAPGSTPDVKHAGNVPAKKLGFGLVGSGKRTAVPSVFHEEEDDDAQKEKKMRPLVPIDYSTEELQAIHTNDGEAPPIPSASAESGKHINPREAKSDVERDRSRRSHDRSSHRDRGHERDGDEAPRGREILDAKQLIDMIPKTKEDLFSYEINWVVYDENRLHERMRPWISKKITEFLGEEETTLVEFIVERFREHVKAEKMLDVLQRILDEEAEMFVLKMWRMLIFEIKKVETGLTTRPGA
ncbi:RNA-binding protein 25-like isoform X1 [Chenopodium quinoa]|uniref:RNA-binding protein 25-like isoform X1 n=2 Tax=Chenopodium quinoa TaxID=63459 RepID=UPI000B786589|nr:RNA-binding protein 25-like isoform X1 [Chenopodium quinoa]